MMLSRTVFLAALFFISSMSGFAGEIQGRITDPQGAAIPNASIVVQSSDTSSSRTVVSTEDGRFVVPDLSPGSYTLRAARQGFAQAMQGPFEISASTNLSVDFRLAQARQTEEVRGTEERNPNDFVIRLDTNGIMNEIARVGTALRYIPEFRADQSSYGEFYSYPLRRENWAVPARPLSAFHGSIYEMHQNQALNARPFFQVGALKPSRRNQYGFNIGGPIRRDSMSFNFAWGQVKDSGFVNGNVQVPLPEERIPLTNDPALRDIVSQLMKAYPNERPNRTEFTPRHLNTNAERDINSTAFSLDWDWQISDKTRLAYDQLFQDSTEIPFELVIGQNPLSKIRPQSYHLTLVRDFSSNTVAQFRFDYDRLGALITTTDKYQDLLDPIGISIPPDIEVGEEVTNIGPFQGIPRLRYENHFVFSPQVAFVRGSHNISAGYSAKSFRDNDLRSSFARGEFIFTSDFSSNSCNAAVCTALENFRLGRFTRGTYGVGQQYQGFRWWEHGFFVHDRFRLRQNLTLSLGLRYEITTAPVEVDNLTLFPFTTDSNNFAPQFGFAWTPGGGKTVLRGAYGLSYGDIPLAGFNRQRSNPPTVQQFGLTPTDGDLRIVRNPPQKTPGTRAGKSVLGPNLVVPYSHLYNFAIERELPGNALLRVAYLGSRTFKLLTGAVTNRAEPSATLSNTSATVNARRPAQNFFRIYSIINSSISYQDAFQAFINKRLAAGLTFQATYTFSKSIDSSAHDFADFGSTRDVSQTSVIMSDMKSLSRFDTPHSLAFNYSYGLPSFEDYSGLRWALLRNWTVSGTTILRSGTPFSVFTGSDSPGRGNVDGENGDRPNILDPSLLGESFDDPDTSPSLLRAQSFDTNIFRANQPGGGRGNLGYSTFRKDGMNNWNVAFARNFPVRESVQFQLRAEFFNFFNRAQFRAPGSFVTSPTFGKITDTVNKGRFSQLTLRLVF